MSKILEVITNPNPILRKVSRKVDIEDVKKGAYDELFADMTQTMLKKDGVGLAAPQIAKNIRIVIINFDNEILTIVNPEITKKSWSKKVGEEGCLSVPNVFGQVSRHKSINIVYYDEKGKKKKLLAKDMLARILQHEIDHLDAILFIDKAENIKQD